MKGYLLDTNQIGQGVRKNSVVRARIKTVVDQGVRVGTCIPVLCEIEAGAVVVQNIREYHDGLRGVLKHIRIWPLTLQTANGYGEIFNDLRKRGRALSQVDMLLAALCRELDLTLVTSDKDFVALPWLRTENWS